MPTTPKKPQGPKCTLCRQVFRTNAELVEHGLRTGHGADRCCEPCSRVFGTKEGLDAHIKSSVHARTPSCGPSNNLKSAKVSATKAPPVTTKQEKCTLCSRLFKKKAHLAQHCLASGHGDDRCCRPCQRLFSTREALEAHKQSPTCKGAVSQDAQAPTPQTSQQSQPLICRGNSYRLIPPQDQAGVLQALLSQCHPRDTLRRHGYKNLEAGISQGEPGPHGGVRATGDEAPPPRQGDNRRRSARSAVVVDCEMVGVAGGASELVSLSALDLLTGEVVVDSLVVPVRPVADWRTQIHGISPATLAAARAGGMALDGWQAARAELFRHVDEDTVLVGHSLQNDLAVLHIRHDRVVDSAILASEAVFGSDGKRRSWGLGLKNVCSELLGLKIREEAPLGASKVHDGLEDVLATREVVLCCLEQPAVFGAWARGKGSACAAAQPRKARRGKTQACGRQKGPRVNDEQRSDSGYMSDEIEILRWEDVIDYDMWPNKSP